MEKKYSNRDFTELAKRSRQTIDKWVRLGLVSDNLFAGKRYFTQEDVDNIPKIKLEMRKQSGKSRG